MGGACVGGACVGEACVGGACVGGACVGGACVGEVRDVHINTARSGLQKGLCSKLCV